MGQVTRFDRLHWEPDTKASWASNPGVLSGISNMIPTIRGTYSTPGIGTWKAGAFSGGVPTIAYIFTQVDGTTRFLAGCTTEIDEYITYTATVQGSSYTGSNWSMAAMGNSIIATNDADAVQVSTGTTFGALGGSPPKAKIVCVQSNFVLLFNCNDGGSFTQGDTWACSGLANTTSWTTGAADLTTGANNGRLLSAPGEITAAIPLRDSVVAFKKDSIFVGQYAGNPFTFTWRMISNQVGCPAMHGVTEFGGVLYFHHTSGFWSFDGSTLRNIGAGVINSYMLTSLGYGNGFISDVGEIDQTQTTVDEQNGNVVFLFKTRPTGYPRDQVITYNVRNGLWGSANLLAIAEIPGSVTSTTTTLVKSSLSQQITYNNVSYCRVPYFEYLSASTSLTLRFLTYGTGQGGTMTDGHSLTTGRFGDRNQVKQVKRVYGEYFADPTSGSSLVVTGYAPSGTYNGTYNTAMQSFDLNARGKFFVFQHGFTANAEVDAVAIEFDPAGDK